MNKQTHIGMYSNNIIKYGPQAIDILEGKSMAKVARDTGAHINTIVGSFKKIVRGADREIFDKSGGKLTGLRIFDKELIPKIQALIERYGHNDQDDAKESDMTDSYSYSTDEENYHGDFTTKTEAAEEAFRENEHIETVWVGENIKYTSYDFVSGYQILEGISDCAYDDVGDPSEDWLFDLRHNKEKCNELRKLVADWIDTDEPPNFWTVTKVEEINRGEK